MSHDELTGLRRVWAMLAISLAVGMATLDTAITNTALPTITSALNASPSSIIWVVTSYQLVMVAAMLPLAALGDVLGHRKVFLVGLVLFTGASFACGAAWSLPSLIAARALQGLGAAALMSANTALVRLIYPDQQLGHGLGLNALVIAFGVAAGPTVASVVLSFTTWHWLFLMNVPAGVLALLLAWRVLPLHHAARRAYDGRAALYCALMFALLVHGAGDYAQGAPLLQAGAEWLVAAALYYALIKRQAAAETPMLAVDLFRSPIFALSTVAAFCAFIAQGLAYVALPFFFQQALGLSQVQTGLFITPWPAVGALMAPLAGNLADRHPAGLMGGLGLLCLALGIGALSLLPAGIESGVIVGSMVLCGFGFGLFLSPNQRILMSSAPRARSGAASGILGVSRILGQATGAVIVAFCLRFSGVANGPQIALWIGCAVALIGAMASALRLIRRR